MGVPPMRGEGILPSQGPNRGQDARETHGRDAHATHGRDARATTSSDERLPHLAWRRTWLLTAVICAAFLGLYEAFGRSKGIAPAITDDATAWCYARGQIGRGSASEIALIGSSRMQLGIHTQVLCDELGCRPVQLAIDGSGGLPVLRDLAQDEGFRGTVICEVLPGAFYAGMEFDAGRPAEYIRQYRHQLAIAPIEQRLRLLAQSAFALKSPDFSPSRAWGALRGKPVSARYITTLDDRSRLADYTKVDVKKLIGRRVARARELKVGATPERFEKDLDEMESLVAAIHARGGRVVFVAFPTGLERKKIEDDLYPRGQYWDRLAAHTAAVAIHWEDHRGLCFDCPDGSHLDYRDAKLFTAEIARIVKERLRK